MREYRIVFPNSKFYVNPQELKNYHYYKSRFAHLVQCNCMRVEIELWQINPMSREYFEKVKKDLLYMQQKSSGQIFPNIKDEEFIKLTEKEMFCMAQNINKYLNFK